MIFQICFISFFNRYMESVLTHKNSHCLYKPCLPAVPSLVVISFMSKLSYFRSICNSAIFWQLSNFKSSRQTISSNVHHHCDTLKHSIFCQFLFCYTFFILIRSIIKLNFISDFYRRPSLIVISNFVFPPSPSPMTNIGHNYYEH